MTGSRVTWAAAAAAGLIALLGLGALAVLPRALPLSVAAAPTDAAIVERGAYLAKAGDCAACHTAPGGAPYAGGLALQTPFGAITASNITPDRANGIGGWSEAAFARALRQGISRDGHMLYPAMPYTAYTKFSDADIGALKAYFDAIPPVAHAVVADQLPFPYNIRLLMLGWNMLFFHDGRFEPDPHKSETWNRGAYLVDGPGHCASCHTGKNALGGDEAYLEGGELENWYAPELSGNAYLGLGNWPAADIVAYLKHGSTDRATANGPMAEAVEHSTQFLTDADLAAIAAYLKSLPGSGRAPPSAIPAADPEMADGRGLYAVDCAACHRASGAGVATMLPALAGNPVAQSPDPISVIHTILSGGAVAATRTNPTGAHMPGLAWKLDDHAAAAVATYIRNAWGNAAGRVSAADVARIRKTIDAPSPSATGPSP